MKHLNEEDLILLYYSEPGVPDNARSHLAECAECRAAAETLAGTLRVCSEWTVPERPAGFGRDVWARLVPGLYPVKREPAKTAHWWNGLRPLNVWTSAAALAMLLVAVFFAGRYSRTPEKPVIAGLASSGLSEQARERILAITVADHLDRVQILLTEIANTNPSAASDFADERARAEDLVHEGRLMRQTLADQGETVTTNFLDEVQRFLIETAHTPDSLNAEELRSLRGRMESGSLLFKVRVVESNLRNEEQKL